MNGLSERSDMIKRCWKDTCTSNAYSELYNIYKNNDALQIYFRYTSLVIKWVVFQK